MHTQALESDWAQVAALAAVVDAGLGAWLTRTYGIGLTEYRGLVHVSGTAEKELRVGDLSRRLGLNQSSTTRLVGRLEAKGLARRDVCDDDARGVFAVITAAGEALVAAAREGYESALRELLVAAVEDDPRLDRAGLARALRAVGESVEE